MEKQISFTKLIEHLCKRPRMYTPDGTYNEVVAFIQGYLLANKTPIGSRMFHRYVCLKNSFPTNYGWSYVIKECTKNDQEALFLMEKTILEFIDLRNTMTEEELIQKAIEGGNIEDNEVEKIFRVFEKALLIGDKDIIQSLIIENKDAELLWLGSYPKDVENALNELSESQPIKSIPISENGDTVKIISQDWPFPILMNLIDGNWKINADRIIELRKVNNTTH